MCPKIIFMIIFFYLHENGFVHFKLKSIIIYNDCWLAGYITFSGFYVQIIAISYKSDSPSRLREQQFSKWIKHFIDVGELVNSTEYEFWFCV